MAKSLNFNNVKKQFMNVTLADEAKTVLLITMPNKALIDEFVGLHTTLKADVGEINGDELSVMYGLVAKLMSNNKAKKTITTEYLETLFDFEDLILFINAYTEFINDVVSQKN